MPLTRKPKGFSTSFQNHQLITEFQFIGVATSLLKAITLVVFYKSVE